MKKKKLKKKLLKLKWNKMIKINTKALKKQNLENS